MAYVQGQGPAYQYLFGQGDVNGDLSVAATVILSFTAIAQADLETIAAALCGGTPPAGYVIKQDGPPGTVKTY